MAIVPTGLTPSEIAGGGLASLFGGSDLSPFISMMAPQASGGASVAQSTPGPNQDLLTQLLKSVSGNAGTTINSLLGGQQNPFITSLSRGQIPGALLQQFRTQQGLNNAGITESFGKVGARFGTDLAGTLAQESSKSLNDLAVNAILRAISAQDLIQSGQLGALGVLPGLFGTGVNAETISQQGDLDRAFKEWLTNNPMSLLLALLGL